MKKEVSNRVYELRERMRMTQEELAHEVGVSRQTIIAIEKGNYTPSVFLALTISRYFNKKLEDVFYLT